MLTQKIISIVLVGCGLLLTGCAGDDGTDSAVQNDEGTNVGLTPSSFEYGNGLLPACFWSAGAQKTLRKLGEAAIADGSGTMPAMPNLLSTCNDVAKYAVQCALDGTQSVTNPQNGDVYQGAVGLATNWRTRGLQGDEKRWVTACMIQRLNALGLKVPILLEGDHAPLYQSTALDAKYPFQESSAFGDLFLPSTTPIPLLGSAFTAYVCSEENVGNQCVNASNLLNIRICDNVGLLCGMKYIGKCSEKCTANGPYWDCSNYPNGLAETIRVQTQDNLCL